MRREQKKSIRHMKKIPKGISKKDKIPFLTIFQQIFFEDELEDLKRIVTRLSINDANKKKKIIHIIKLLGEIDYAKLHWIVYCLALSGFKFVDIEYLLLHIITDRRLSKWTNEYLSKPFLQTPVQIILYRDEELEELIKEYQSKSKIKYVDDAKQENRRVIMLQKIYQCEIVVLDLKAKKSLNLNSFIQELPKRENRKK